MSLNSGFATNGLFNPPPNENLEQNLRLLLQGESFDKDSALYPSPIMEHEEYHRHEYGKPYPDSNQSVGLGTQYDNQYEHILPTYYSTESCQSHALSPFMQSAVPSPPTPISLHGDAGRQSISGRLRTESPVCSSRKSTPSRVAKKRASKTKKTPTLTAPLSILTKDMVSVPIRDMQAWVNRPRSERTKETERRNGYVTRPMNSFMLYRSAYSERTKVWCVGNNHQVVSSVSGESWPLEPPEIRNFYNELAKIERINHQMTHPDYKFSPAKPGAAGKNFKRKEPESDEESDPSDPNDADADWSSTHYTRAKQVKRPGRDAGYPARANLSDAQNAQSFQTMHAYDSYNQNQQAYQQQVSAYHQNNNQQHSPLTPIKQHDPYKHQYYQQPLQGHSQMLHAAVNHMGYRMDNLGYGTNNVIGLPSSQQVVDSQLDPLLFGAHNSLGGTQYDPSFQLDSGIAPPFSATSSAHHAEFGRGGGGYQQHSQQVDGFVKPVSEFEKYWHDDRRTSVRGQVGLTLGGVRE